MTPRPLTDAERAELRALLAKATEAPWFVVGPPWNRGEPFINARTEDPHGGQPVCDFAIQAENDDGGPQSDPHPIEDAVLVCALRNHAEALLDAADELARLKAGVADRDHTTHFDDCGCRSARYEAEVARLREALRDADALLTKVFGVWRSEDGKQRTYRTPAWDVFGESLPMERVDAIHAAALASAPGSTDTLREVCERAWRAGSLHGMGGCNPTDGPPWTEADDKRMAAEVANILGERVKEGGDA